MNAPLKTTPLEATEQDDLERLRDLLLGKEKQAVAQIRERLADRGLRTEEIAGVLAEAIEIAQKNGEGISESLARPVEKAVVSSIKKDPETFANILYPSILPAIRRAIQAALNQFIETTDALVSQNFSLNAIKWRFESMRTGIPLAEILLRHTLVYSVEQVLLIHNRSGLLIEDVYANDAIKRDSDAVSGMLSAIESFMHDSFNSEEGEKLSRVRLGNHIVYLAHGPSATLASVVRGSATPDYPERMRSVIEKIHAKKPNALERFKGDKSSLKGITPLLDTCLKTRYKEPAGKNSDNGRIAKLIGYGLAALLLLLVGFKVMNSLEANRVDNLVGKLNARPGTVVYKHFKENGKWHILGMLDSRLKTPKIKWTDFSLKPGEIIFDWTRFQSVDSPQSSGRSLDTAGRLISK